MPTGHVAIATTTPHRLKTRGYVSQNGNITSSFTGSGKRFAPQAHFRCSVCISRTPCRAPLNHSNRSGALNLARSSGHHATYRSSIRPPIRCAAEGMMGGDEEGDDDEVDESAEGVAKMRVKEIKAELDLRGVGYAGVFEKVCPMFLL